MTLSYKFEDIARCGTDLSLESCSYLNLPYETDTNIRQEKVVPEHTMKTWGNEGITPHIPNSGYK